MDRNYQTRHIYLAISIIIAIFAPIFYFFLPQTVGDIVHHKDDVFFVSVPKENFYAFGVGFILLFISSMILFLFDIKKISIVFSILFLSFSLGTFYFSAQSFSALGQEKISYSPLFSLKKESHAWDEVTKVIHHRNDVGDVSFYEFVFEDGNHIILEDNDYFRHASYKFEMKLAEHNLSPEFSLIEEED